MHMAASCRIRRSRNSRGLAATSPRIDRGAQRHLTLGKRSADPPSSVAEYPTQVAELLPQPPCLGMEVGAGRLARPEPLGRSVRVTGAGRTQIRPPGASIRITAPA